MTVKAWSNGDLVNADDLDRWEKGAAGASASVDAYIPFAVSTTAAFVEAMTAVNAAGGGDVLAKGSAYDVEALTVLAGVTLRGQGGTLTRTGTGQTFVTMQSGARLVGLDLDFGGTGPSGSRAVLIASVADVTLEDFAIRNMTVDSSSSAISINGSTNVTIKSGLVDGCYHGVHILNASRFVTVDFVWIKNHRNRGIYVASTGSNAPADIDILRCKLTDMAGGTTHTRAMIQCIGSATARLARIRIQGSTVIGPGRAWTDPVNPGTMDQINCSFVDGLKIIDNWSTYGGDCGISGALNTCVLITENHCLYNDSTGIALGGAAGGTASTTVTANVSMNNGQDKVGDRGFRGHNGIYLYGATDCTVTDNNVGDNQGSPTQWIGVVVLNSSTGVTLRGNKAAGVKVTDYWDDGTIGDLDMQDRRVVSSPATGYWPRGAVVRNSAPTPGADVGWIATTGGGASGSVWTASTAYTAGQYVRTSSGKVFYCLTGGTSGTTQPLGSGSLGSTQPVDGTVTWVYFAAASAVFKSSGLIAA